MDGPWEHDAKWVESKKTYCIVLLICGILKWWTHGNTDKFTRGWGNWRDVGQRVQTCSYRKSFGDLTPSTVIIVNSIIIVSSTILYTWKVAKRLDLKCTHHKKDRLLGDMMVVLQWCVYQMNMLCAFELTHCYIISYRSKQKAFYTSLLTTSKYQAQRERISFKDSLRSWFIFNSDFINS